MSSTYCEIIPGLFLTNWYAASDIAMLKQYRIQAIVTVEHSKRGLAFYDFLRENGISIMEVEIDDLPDEPISTYFNATADFIEEHLPRGNVVVHCMAGISRSTTIVANFLLRNLYRKRQAEPESAVSFIINNIRANRPEVNPNAGFLRQLVNMATFYSRERKKDDEKSNLNYSQPTISTSMSDDCVGFVTEAGEKGKVIALSDSDFDQQGNLINFPDVTGIIMYYADWCGHCKTLKPKFAELSTAISGNNRAFVVNSDKAKDLLARANLDSFGYEVKGFPTVVGYNKGKYYSTYAPDKSSKNPYRSVGDMMEFLQGLGTAPIEWE